MDLLTAAGAELTTEKIPSPEVRVLAKSLGVTAQSVKDLHRREESALIADVADLGAQGQQALVMEKQLREFSRRDSDNQRAFWFLRSEVWTMDQWLALKQAITLAEWAVKRWGTGVR